MMTLRLVGLATALVLLATDASQAQFVVCSGPGLQMASHSIEIRGLYLLEQSRGCWQPVSNTGVSEGTILGAGDIPQFARRSTATFAYLLPRSQSETVLVLKQRVFRPADVIVDGKLKPIDDAVPHVVLKRGAVESSCGNRTDLDSFRPDIHGGNVTVDVNVYNRFHDQQYSFVPATDEIRAFHFSYPTGPNCTDTGGQASRSHYVLRRLFEDPENFLAAWFANNVTARPSRNAYYSKLVVENRSIKPPPLSARRNEPYTVVKFKGDGRVGTRSEVTIADLQAAGETTTWQLGWK